MKSFVLLLDPSNCDLEQTLNTSPPTATTPSSQPTPSTSTTEQRKEQLRHLWNAWNGKARKLLDQESRIENLFWRRWHLEQKEPNMYSQLPMYPVAAVSNSSSAGPTSSSTSTSQFGVAGIGMGMGMGMGMGYPVVPPLGLTASSSSNAHFDRINEAGRQASRDLEAFLSNTLHNAQPPIIANPPTFPPPSPYTQLHQNLTNATPSPHLVAPQPYRPSPFAQPPLHHHQHHHYQPSPEWAYNSIPPSSMPPPHSLPPTSNATGNQNRIIATPSWTALISDSSPQLHQSSVPVPVPVPHSQASAAANYYPPAPAPSSSSSASNPQPPTLPPPSPFPVSTAPSSSNPYSFFAHPHSTAPPLHGHTSHSHSFTLPPSATLFSDLPSALSSMGGQDQQPPPPLSFYSSYGSYQPIITPYPRFLTPSPEPSILGELELELELGELGELEGTGVGVGVGPGVGPGGGGTNGTLDYEEVIAGTGIEDGPGPETGAATGEEGEGDQEMSSVWKEFGSSNDHDGTDERSSRGGGRTVSIQPEASTSAPTPTGIGSKRDPFEGMSLAQIRSRANSLEAVDRDHAAGRYKSFRGGGGGGGEGGGSGFEVNGQVNGKGRENRKGKGKEKESLKGKRKNSRGDGGTAGKKNKNLVAAAGSAPSTATSNQDSVPIASSPSTIESTSPTLTTASEDASPNFDNQNGFGSGGGVGGKNGGGASSTGAGSKKNRNPHATQLPGNGQRKLAKEEAGEGHSGPICSHCGSITTPLWRRGPDDELLCNACGLYLKLHSKPRPKTFGKGAGGTKRTLNGAAAKAAASGVPPVCSNCACTSTPMWRVLDGKLSCNACSLYFKLHKVPRPASLAQKRAAAAAAKLDETNPSSAATSPGDRPPILTPSDTSSAAPTPSTSTIAVLQSHSHSNGDGGDPTKMNISPSTNPAPLQPAVMPPPLHHTTGVASLIQPFVPSTTTTTPWTSSWSTAPPSSTSTVSAPSQFQDSNPFAQTEWGRLAYQLVSAAAEEEAGQTHHPGAGGGGGGGGGAS
ncbi:GATA-type transcription factor [Sporobolomyces salmoneus]|uniref:GATA-type transcription factor n=1 Tax=Sporobolomyces salmoneus TaxID=183962 RepID=UPI003179BF4A